MAVATFKFVPNPTLGGFGDAGQRSISYYGSITFSAAGDTYATGGLLPLAGFAFKNLGPYADRTPLFNYVNSTAGQSWFYLWNQSTGKLQIFAGGAAADNAHSQSEANAVALNALLNSGSGGGSVATDTVLFNVTFPRV